MPAVGERHPCPRGEQVAAEAVVEAAAVDRYEMAVLRIIVGTEAVGAGQRRRLRTADAV